MVFSILAWNSHLDRFRPSPGCFGPLSRVWGRAGKFGFLVELGFAVDFVAGAVLFDCSGDGSLTNRDKLHPETVDLFLFHVFCLIPACYWVFACEICPVDRGFLWKTVLGERKKVIFVLNMELA